MLEFKLTTPVAFVIFNRPDTTARVFAEIAKARPPKLLVVADGARLDRPGELEKVAQTRAIIQSVDWPCEVLTNFSDVNLGCKKRVSSGLDWVFETVAEAIILEDDCLPEASFFRFCQEMLERYRHDQRVGMISGDNFQFGKTYGSDSYYFSKYVHIWGWASWRDRWVGSYDVEIAAWKKVKEAGRVNDLVGNAREAKYWTKIFDRVCRGGIDTWDYQWLFVNWLSARSSVMPSVNLISNIGFSRNDATHTKGASRVAAMDVEPMKFPLCHPLGMTRNLRADAVNHANCFAVPLWIRVMGRLIGLLRTTFK